MYCKRLQWLQYLLIAIGSAKAYALSGKPGVWKRSRTFVLSSKLANIYYQINNFCQVSAGYDMPVTWNLSFTG